ncbi:MAG TPA: hypothetical protein VMX13_08205 [Sedimentisphaerales bacterium]|nr:hypothetical protein [Sedimentisphaerales bacterium]
MKVVAHVAQGRYSGWVVGKKVLKSASFAEKVNEFQLVSFRTGAYGQLGVGKDKNADDLPMCGGPLPEAVHYLNNVSILPQSRFFNSGSAWIGFDMKTRRIHNPPAELERILVM